MAEKAETASGWLFPVGDELAELGYVDMFADMFNAMDEGREPIETFYDGYVVNAVMDACYASAKSKRWEPIALERVARRAGGRGDSQGGAVHEGHVIIKQEKMPDGRMKLILKDPPDRRLPRRHFLNPYQFDLHRLDVDQTDQEKQSGKA